MFEKATIYIAPNLKVNELLSNGKEEELIKLINETIYADPTIEICSPSDFLPGFKEGLEKDDAMLKELVEAWSKIDYDPKLDIFLDYLKNRLFDKDINNEGKLLVFSESKETTKYLSDALKKEGYTRLLTVQSANRNEMMPVLRENFDANYEGERKNDFDIIISTEVLAEGVNLHRANIIVNYDTPWNSTRLMQRIGRVNRIGSTANKIYIFNFFPTAKVNNDIELEKKAKMKLFAFHAALGEDSQIYSTDETPETFGLFDKDVDEERDEKLRYLMWLRNLKEEDPDLIKSIAKLPLRARVGRKNKVKRVARAIEVFAEQEEDTKATTSKVNVAQGPNEKKAIAYLDGFLSIPNITDEETELIHKAKRAITTGKFQQLQRDVNKLKTSVKKTPIKPAVLLEKMINLISAYPLDTVNLNESKAKNSSIVQAKKEVHPEIIISESFNS